MPKLMLRQIPLAVLLLSCSIAAAPIYAQSNPPVAQADPAIVRAYDLPVQSLNISVVTIAEQSGVRISLEAELARDLMAAPVRGNFSAEGALRQALTGTGLSLVHTSAGVFTVRRAAPGMQAESLPTIQVTGEAESGEGNAYRARSADLGALGSSSLFDTPYSVEVFTRDLLDNKQASSLNDAVKGDASVSLTTNNIGGLASQISVRGVGLDLLNGRKIDGLNVFSWSSELPLEHFERIELLKGAGGFLYGFAQPGGILNYVSKRPTETPTASLATQITDSGTFLVHGDVGGRLADERFGYRINLVDEQGGTYVEQGKIRRRSGSVALDWRLTPELTWGVDALTQERRVNGSTSWGIYPNSSGMTGDYVVALPPSAINGGKRIFSPFTSYETRGSVYGTELAWRFLPDWNARVSYREADMTRIYLNGALYANAAGAYSEEMYAGVDRFKTDETQLLVTGKFSTGFIGHRIAFGGSYANARSFTSSVSGYQELGSGNLSNPSTFTNPDLPIGPIDTQLSEVRMRSVYASDTLRLSEQWDIIAGLRHSSISDRYNKYETQATTPTVALIHHPVSWVSLYGSYVEALEQGKTAPITAANANQTFGPVKSKQVEVGIKTDRPDWSANLAVFRIQQGLAYTTDNNVYTQDGEARFEGIELGGKLLLDKQWTINASALLLDAKNTKTTNDISGRRVAGTPRHQLNAYLEYAVPETGLVFSAGGQYYGERPIDSANTVTLPSYTLFDIGARYVTKVNGVRTTMRLNIDNLADKAYWLTSASTLTQGVPRTIKFGLQFDM